jgi:hypothetical protein
MMSKLELMSSNQAENLLEGSIGAGGLGEAGGRLVYEGSSGRT